MQIIAYSVNSSFVNGHILVLNLHSMCAVHLANVGKTSPLSWFESSCIDLPLVYVFFFLRSVIYFVSLWNLSPCFIIFLISVCTYTSIYYISRRIAPLHSIAWSWSGWNYFFAKPSVAVPQYCLLHISSSVDLGLQIFFAAATSIVWLHPSLFYALHWHQSISCRFILKRVNHSDSYWFSSDAVTLTCLRVGITLPTTVLALM